MTEVTDFSVNIGKVEFQHPIMNGAGHCKGFQHLDELVNSASSAIVIGSITAEPRDGNPSGNY